MTTSDPDSSPSAGTGADPAGSPDSPARGLPRRTFLGLLVVAGVIGAGAVTAARDRTAAARGFTAIAGTADASLAPVAEAGFGDTVPVLDRPVTGLGVQRAFSLHPSLSLGGRWPVLTGQDAFNGRVEAWVRQAVADCADKYANAGVFTPVATPVPGHAADGSYVAPADAVDAADAMRANGSPDRADAAETVGLFAGSVLDTSGLAGSTRGDIGTLLADRAEFPAPQEHGHLIAIACDTTLAAGTVLGVQLRASRAATIDGAHRSLFEQRQSVFVDIATGTCGAGDSLLTAVGRDTAIARLRTLLGSVAPADIGTSRRDAPAYDPLQDALDAGTLLDDVSVDPAGQLVVRLAVTADRIDDAQRRAWADGLRTPGLLCVRVALDDSAWTDLGRTVRAAAMAETPWAGPARAAASDAQVAGTQATFTTGDALPAFARARAAGTTPADAAGASVEEAARSATLVAGTTTTSAVPTRTADEVTVPTEDGPVRPTAYAWPVPCDLVPAAAVTFDDGPGEYTAEILAAFAAAGVHGSFMVEGQHAEQYPQRVRDEIAGGHTVCDHSWDHPALTDLTAAQVRDQITRTDDMVERVCGVRPRFVRPPYGFYDDTVVQASPHPLVVWDVDSLDWEEPGQRVVHDKILREASTGSIVLMHDVHEPTKAMMPGLLRDLRAAGFTVVSLATLFAHADDQAEQAVIRRLDLA